MTIMSMSLFATRLQTLPALSLSCMVLTLARLPSAAVLDMVRHALCQSVQVGPAYRTIILGIPASDMHQDQLLVQLGSELFAVRKRRLPQLRAIKRQKNLPGHDLLL